VNGEQAGAYTYLMEFRPVRELDDNVVLQHHDDLRWPIPANSAELLQGATLEFNGGMVMQNPPARSRVTGDADAAGDLSGDVPQRVIQVLEQQINPAIASHGGPPSSSRSRTTSRTCASRVLPGMRHGLVTLSQGIEVAILDTVRTITEVIDVTTTPPVRTRTTRPPRSS